MVIVCRGGGMPRPPNSIRRNRRGVRLPLEGKLAQRQLRLMRSKLTIITMGWYNAFTFDLIRHAIRRDTFPSRGRLFSVPFISASVFAARSIQVGGRGMPTPLQSLVRGFAKKSPRRVRRGIYAYSDIPSFETFPAQGRSQLFGLPILGIRHFSGSASTRIISGPMRHILHQGMR